MNHRRRLWARLVASGSAVLLAVSAIGGCGGTTQTETERTPSGPAPTATVTDDVLLPPAEMPVWNGALVWAEAALPSDESALQICALPELTSLEAVALASRDYEATPSPELEATPDPTAKPMHGTNTVAVFATLAAASAALRSWEEALADCLPGPAGPASSPSARITDLPVGSTWSMAAANPDDPAVQRFEFVGVSAQGMAVTVVGFELYGQDANYEGDPLAASMDASLARLP